jgi:hypothetical protein
MLGRTIRSYFEFYAKNSKTPFVIFYSNNSTFSIQLVNEELSTLGNNSAIVFYHPVNLADISDMPSDPFCAFASMEYLGMTYFLRFEAPRVLEAMGYDWLFRFGENAVLNKPIAYNLFERMSFSQKKYGYTRVIADPEGCFTATWSVMDRICDVLSGDLLLKCSSLQKSWQRGLSVSSVFEISHVSVWRRPVCQVFENFVNDFANSNSSSISSSNRNSRSRSRSLKYSNESASVSSLQSIEFISSSVIDKLIALKELSLRSSELLASTDRLTWGDPIIHTVCAVAALQELRCTDIEYSFTYDYNLHSNIQTGVDSIDTTRKYLRTALHHLDEQFYPKRFGWIGGDVASSLALPSEDGLSRYVWMFGDSLV